MASARLSASDRLERLLSMIPWVVANDGPTLAEISERFDYPSRHLVADLNEVLFMVGTYPYTPDQLVEVVIEDDRVWIHYAEYFSRPLRLTPDQALALVASSSGLLSAPGADPDGPLARGLAKVAATLGVDPEAVVGIDLGDAAAPVLQQLREALALNRQLRIDYYAYGRDEVTERVVDPYRLTHEQGHWYLLAHCNSAGGERLFRIDRIRSVELLDSEFAAPEEDHGVSVFEPRPDDPRVTLILNRGAAWVPEAFPCESVEDLGDGRLRVTLAVTAMAWLERLLLRLGPDVGVESATGMTVEDLAAGAARRVLARYR